jgi:hypothetical protein
MHSGQNERRVHCRMSRACGCQALESRRTANVSFPAVPFSSHAVDNAAPSAPAWCPMPLLPLQRIGAIATRGSYLDPDELVALCLKALDDVCYLHPGSQSVDQTFVCRSNPQESSPGHVHGVQEQGAATFGCISHARWDPLYPIGSSYDVFPARLTPPHHGQAHVHGWQIWM